jgi:hypothetical protein
MRIIGWHTGEELVLARLLALSRDRPAIAGKWKNGAERPASGCGIEFRRGWSVVPPVQVPHSRDTVFGQPGK